MDVLRDGIIRIFTLLSVAYLRGCSPNWPWEKYEGRLPAASFSNSGKAFTRTSRDLGQLSRGIGLCLIRHSSAVPIVVFINREPADYAFRIQTSEIELKQPNA